METKLPHNMYPSLFIQVLLDCLPINFLSIRPSLPQSLVQSLILWNHMCFLEVGLAECFRSLGLPSGPVPWMMVHKYWDSVASMIEAHRIIVPIVVASFGKPMCPGRVWSQAFWAPMGPNGLGPVQIQWSSCAAGFREILQI